MVRPGRERKSLRRCGIGGDRKRSVTRTRRLASLWWVPLLFAAFPVAAESTPLVPTIITQEAEADETLSELAPLRVFLITMDQGDEVWERFGHNAILVRNEATGQEIAWNWGLFNFDDVDFIPRFLQGTMLYTMGGMDPGWMVQQYAADNRTVYAHEVLLTPAEAMELDAFVRWNALEENRDYVYDYFRDNCSTRVRDVLDLAVGGQLEEIFGDRLTPYSWRWHARRLVRETGWIDQGLSFLLGTRGDRAITDWEAMFVPMVLMEHLEGVRLADGPGRGRALLGPRQVLHQADREPAPDGPPPLSPLFPLLGILGAGALILLANGAMGRGRSARWSRIGLGISGMAWAVFSGVLGWILVLVWFTDHVFIHRNLNLLYFSPLAPFAGALLLAALFSADRARGWVGRSGAVLAVAVALGSLIGVLLQLSGIVTQGNAEVVSVGLPLNLALALALLRVHRGRSTP